MYILISISLYIYIIYVYMLYIYYIYIYHIYRERGRERKREIDRYDNQEEVGTQHVFSYFTFKKFIKMKKI